MKGKTPNKRQKQFLYHGLAEMLNPKEKLYQLANIIPWEELEKNLLPKYAEKGRPAKPVRLMSSLLLLKQLYNLGDETVVEAWKQNPYFQYFSGEQVFQWKMPVEPSDLVHFRKRIGEEGVEEILKITILLHGKKANEKECVVDTTVQEKNITYPTDSKLHKKIIDKCNTIAKKEDISLRQSYTRTSKKLNIAQQHRKHPKNRTKARKAAKKLKTIAGRLVREVERKLPAKKQKAYAEEIARFNKVLEQKKKDKNKIYSLHEPEVYCMSKGKEHKQYEFGSKSSFVTTKNSGVIIGAMTIKENQYDGHTLPAVLRQVERLTSKRPKIVIADRGYRGKKIIEGSTIKVPGKAPKEQTAYQKRKARKRFRRRAAIEPRIGHLKTDHRLGRSYLKGLVGDNMNTMLAAAAYNLKKWMRETTNIFVFIQNFIKKQFLLSYNF